MPASKLPFFHGVKFIYFGIIYDAKNFVVKCCHWILGNILTSIEISKLTENILVEFLTKFSLASTQTWSEKN